jgi:hypothetical protein
MAKLGSPSPIFNRILAPTRHEWRVGLLGRDRKIIIQLGSLFLFSIASSGPYTIIGAVHFLYVI